jgi:hypothetical protein
MDALVGKNGQQRSPIAFFRGAFNSLYCAALTVVSSEEIEQACYLAMCEAVETYDPERSAFKTWCVGKMRDYVKVLLKNYGVKKSHLPSVEIVEFNILDDDNPEAIAQPEFIDKSADIFDASDYVSSIRNFIPRICFDIFCHKFGVLGKKTMTSDELAEKYKCSKKRIQFICAKSQQVAIAEMSGVLYNIKDLMLEKW